MCDDYGEEPKDGLALPQGREASLHEGHPETSPLDPRTVPVPEPVEEPQARTTGARRPLFYIIFSLYEPQPGP